MAKRTRHPYSVYGWYDDGMVEGFCAMGVLVGFICNPWPRKIPPKETLERWALDFVTQKIKASSRSGLFIGDVVRYGKADADDESGDAMKTPELFGSMQLCIVPYLPKRFEFKHNGKHYKCRVQTSRKYINYNTGNTVRHTIISWTKK